MEVINMKAVVTEILTNIADIQDFSTSYPESWTVFPRAVYHTVRKPHVINFEGKELQSHWTITIELYNDTHSLTDIAVQLTDQFSQIGFRGNYRDNNVAGLKRIVCEFKAIVDNETKLVYQT